MAKKRKITAIFIFILAIVVSGVLVFFALQKLSAHKSVLGEKQEAKSLIDQVGKLIELPMEAPTIATVSDVTKLNNQAFFLHAKNGDKVLIFSQAREAILYRPSENKIITVAPINLQATPTPSLPPVTSTPTTTPTKSLRKISPTEAVNGLSVTVTPRITQ